MTEEQAPNNPFYPGTGFLPEHMAGREPEQALLRKALRTITGPRKKDYGPLRGMAPQPLKIIGPRGMGKTTLISWAEDEIESMEADVVSLTFVPKRSTKDVFSGLLHKIANIPDFNKHKAQAQAYKLLQRAMKWKSGEPPLQDFEEILAARLMFRPLLLLLDEVMHYDLEMLSQILQQSQALARKRWPLAVVLAGTPALNVHLQKVDATFLNRAKNIHINRLDNASTRTALRQPFADRDVAVTDEALELMVSWADNFPYFIQVVGSEVWEAKEADGCSKVDVALVQSTKQAVQKEREDFYESIYEIIEAGHLVEHGMKAVAAIEAAPEPLTPAQVRTCMAKGTDLDEQRTLKIYNQLLDAGLFWQPSARRVGPAIPSFFNYFKEEYKRDHS